MLPKMFLCFIVPLQYVAQFAKLISHPCVGSGVDTCQIYIMNKESAAILEHSFFLFCCMRSWHRLLQCNVGEKVFFCLQRRTTKDKRCLEGRRTDSKSEKPPLSQPLEQREHIVADHQITFQSLMLYRTQGVIFRNFHEKEILKKSFPDFKRPLIRFCILSFRPPPSSFSRWQYHQSRLVSHAIALTASKGIETLDTEFWGCFILTKFLRIDVTLTEMNWAGGTDTACVRESPALWTDPALTGLFTRPSEVSLLNEKMKGFLSLANEESIRKWKLQRKNKWRLVWPLGGVSQCAVRDWYGKKRN